MLTSIVRVEKVFTFIDHEDLGLGFEWSTCCPRIKVFHIDDCAEVEIDCILLEQDPALYGDKIDYLDSVIQAIEHYIANNK